MSDLTPEHRADILRFVQKGVPPPGYDARERERDLLAALDAAEKERERDCQVLRDNHATETRNLREEVVQERAAWHKRDEDCKRAEKERDELRRQRDAILTQPTVPVEVRYTHADPVAEARVAALEKALTEIVMRGVFGAAAVQIAREALAGSPPTAPPPTPATGCRYCGFLAWTVTKYGRVTHKQYCPHRTDPWHQGDPLVRQHEDDGA